MSGPAPEQLTEVNAALRRRAGTRPLADQELSIRCLEPGHSDEHPSASWNGAEGCGRCHSCGASWSTRQAAELLGLEAPTNGYRPETVWEIRSRSGESVARHHRIDQPDGSKRVWWTRPDGSKGLGGRAVSRLPLYLAQTLNSYKNSEPVYVAEGEKAADAAVLLGLQAVGTTSGASGCPDVDVLAELAGFKVIVWPDHDQPGHEHMEKVAETLKKIGVRSVSMVDTSSLWGCEPTADHGLDAADLAALPEGGLPLVGYAPDDMRSLDARLDARESQSVPSETSEYALMHALGGASHASRITPVTVGALLAMQMPPRRWLLHGLIQERDLGMIHAFRGVGKSRFAHGVGLAVASGGSFLRFHADEPRGVLLVDGELPREDLQKMLAQAVAASGSEPAAPFGILSSDLSGEPLPSLAMEGGQEIVERHLDGVSLLILDNISTLFSGAGPENDSESWERAQAWLLGLRRRGVAVELIHHDGKGGAQRGTSRREDVLSQVVQLVRPPDYQPPQGAVFECHFRKSRGLVGPDADPFEATLRTDDNGLPVWTWRPIEDATAARVQDMAGLGMSQREIASELGINQSTVSRALKRARTGDARDAPLGRASTHHWREGA